MSYARHVRVLIPLLPYLARDNASRHPAGKGLPVMQPDFLPLINVELLPVGRNYKNICAPRIQFSKEKVLSFLESFDHLCERTN